MPLQFAAELVTCELSWYMRWRVKSKRKKWETFCSPVQRFILAEEERWNSQELCVGSTLNQFHWPCKQLRLSWTALMNIQGCQMLLSTTLNMEINRLILPLVFQPPVFLLLRLEFNFSNGLWQKVLSGISGNPGTLYQLDYPYPPAHWLPQILAAEASFVRHGF